MDGELEIKTENDNDNQNLDKTGDVRVSDMTLTYMWQWHASDFDHLDQQHEHGTHQGKRQGRCVLFATTTATRTVL